MLSKSVWMVAAALAAGGTAWAAAAPQGWFLAGTKRTEYESGVDKQATYGGQASAYLKSIKPSIDGFGTLMQNFNADEYVGKRVRFSAFVKSEAVLNWAGLWARVDKGEETVWLDNMQDRPIKGTTAWQNYEVVMDVPSGSTRIAFGILLENTGCVWMSGVKFEVVDTNIPVTGKNSAPSGEGPVNLALEGPPTGAPSGWHVGTKPNEYVGGVDAQAAYGGHNSAYLKSNQVSGNTFGTLMQSFKADQYLGKRIRFTAQVRSEDVADWAGLWMRVDKGRQSVSFDNMQSRPIKGTTKWSEYAIVLDVPQESTGVFFGILLSGTGTVWLNSPRIEVVPASVPATGRSTANQPTNLGFEK